MYTDDDYTEVRSMVTLAGACVTAMTTVSYEGREDSRDDLRPSTAGKHVVRRVPAAPTVADRHADGGATRSETALAPYAATVVDPTAQRCGPYKLIRRLARGGMADIFLALAPSTAGIHKHVVIKRMLADLRRDPERERAFVDEALLAAGLHHQNVAQVYEIGRDATGYFIVMEYLHGFDLDVVLARLRARREAMPLQHALTIIAGAAAGLQYAHEQTSPDGQPLGVVHRDATPSNIVVTFDGGVKVIDFGVAKSDHRPHCTVPGIVKGKAGYMSPEQCAGWPLDRRSDIFTLGIVLYELTTLNRPFGGTGDGEVMSAILSSTARPPSSWIPHYPLPLERIVLRSLNPARDARYPTARELLLAVEQLAASLRLPLSPAALGDYMQELFPCRPGPSRTISALALAS
jgi:serine/threonine protein kinase